MCTMWHILCNWKRFALAHESFIGNLTQYIHFNDSICVYVVVYVFVRFVNYLPNVCKVTYLGEALHIILFMAGNSVDFR